MAGALVTVEGVHFRYNGVPVLEDVSFTLDKGALVSIVGPNGGGKSTLLKLIAGLLKPDAGEIRVLGSTPERARRRIGYMPQHVNYDPLFPVTALDVVLMGRVGTRFAGWNTRRDRAIAMAALDELAVAPLAHRPLADLSGGQRQRVLVARALACEPELLLLDEPMANVDVVTEEKFASILRELNKRMGIIMVSHDLGFVSDFVDRVICVNRQVVVHATSEITGAIIHDVYGSPVRMVRHDHIFGEEGHRHG